MWKEHSPHRLPGDYTESWTAEGQSLGLNRSCGDVACWDGRQRCSSIPGAMLANEAWKTPPAVHLPTVAFLPPTPPVHMSQLSYAWCSTHSGPQCRRVLINHVFVCVPFTRLFRSYFTSRGSNESADSDSESILCKPPGSSDHWNNDAVDVRLLCRSVFWFDCRDQHMNDPYEEFSFDAALRDRGAPSSLSVVPFRGRLKGAECISRWRIV